MVSLVFLVGLDVEEGRGTVTVKSPSDNHNAIATADSARARARIHTGALTRCKPGYSQTVDPDHLGVPGAGRKGVTGRNMACPTVPMAPSKPCPTACRPWPTVWTVR